MKRLLYKKMSIISPAGKQLLGLDETQTPLMNNLIGYAKQND